MSDWKKKLRSPLGQVQLLGATLLGATIFAGFLATQQGWFESWIREKPPVTSAATERLANDIEAGKELPIDVADLEKLYGMWLVADALPTAKVAMVLTTDDPDWFHDRVERTLLAGTPAQRIRALELIQTSRDPELIPVLERSLARYQTIGPEEVIDPCRHTLSVVGGR